jgi:hypothetical protein
MKDSNKGTRLYSIELNNYVKPNTQCEIYTSNDYILHGDNNRYFKFVEDRYYGSTTNKAAIDSLNKYIYGLGIFNNGESIKNILSNKDLREFIKDYKMHGQASLEVIYTLGRDIYKLNHIPIKTVGIETTLDYNRKPTKYFICFDWNYKTRFPVDKVSAFGTSTDGRELLVIGMKNHFPYYVLPDYQPILQYTQCEEEVSNFTRNWIDNGLSAGHIINIVRGFEDTIEAQDMASREIKKHLTGSGNAGKYFLSYNDNQESKTTIESIQDTDSHEKYLQISIECQSKILMGHNFFPILLGADKSTGFSNNADEMNTALRILYKNVINPMREEIIDALESVLIINDPLVKLDFKNIKFIDDVEVTIPVETPKDNTISTEEVSMSSDELIFNDEQVNALIEFSERLPIQLADEIKAGIYFQYEGPSPQRSFCSKLISLDRLYSRDEISDMDRLNAQFAKKGNSQYSVFKYRGGVNCKHVWRKIEYQDTKGGQLKRIDRGIVNDSPVGNA